MSNDSTPAPERSPKRKRSDTPDIASGYDGDEAGAALAYAYDDDASEAFHTPDQGSEDEHTPATKRRRSERPQRLNYVPYMTLRGHKRGVAAVKFSPDGKWIASCCEEDAHCRHDDRADIL